MTYRDVERAKVILVAGLDAEQEVPILHLRLRKAAAAGARIVVLHPRRTRLWDVAEHILCRPGDEACAPRPEEGRHRPEIDGSRRAPRGGRRGARDRGPSARGRRRRGAAAVAGGGHGAPIRLRHPARERSRRARGRESTRRSCPGGRASDAEDRRRSRTSWGSLESSASPAATGAGSSRPARTARSTCCSWSASTRSGTTPMRRSPAGPWRTCRRRSCSRSSSARSSPSRTPSCPAAPSWRRTGTSRPGRAAASASTRVRDPLGHVPSRLGDLREPGAGVRRRPGLRDARRAPRGDGRAPGAAGRGRGSTHRPPPRRRRDQDGLTLFTYPLLVDEGRLSERADELKAALADHALRRDPPGRRGRRSPMARTSCSRPRPARRRSRRV